MLSDQEILAIVNTDYHCVQLIEYQAWMPDLQGIFIKLIQSNPQSRFIIFYFIDKKINAEKG